MLGEKSAIIETEGLIKRFGSRRAVDGVTLQVPKGSCYGFLGPNGAGKTTLIRMILGLAYPSEGTLSVRGYSVPRQSREALCKVGGIVEEPAFYPYMTGRQNLEAWAVLYGESAERRIPNLLERVGLTDRSDDRVKTYSLGMRQRLALARCLLSDPELLVLDEPTNGLDPAGMAEFRRLVREMVDEDGRTVFISSHLLDEVEKICDHIAIVSHGKVVVEGPIDDLIKTGGSTIEIDCSDTARASDLLRQLPEVSSVRAKGDGTITVEADATRTNAAAFNRLLVEAGVEVAGLKSSKQSLEQRYLDITAPNAVSENGFNGTGSRLGHGADS